MNIIEERYEIAIERIKELVHETSVQSPFRKYFIEAAEWILLLDKRKTFLENINFYDSDIEELKKWNDRLYHEIYLENYGESFANPEFAVKQLGAEYGQLLCYIYTRLRGLIPYVSSKQWEPVVLRMELFIEIYNYFENPIELEFDNIKETVYSFEKDNTEIFSELRINEIVNPDNKFATDIVMDSDLKDLRYLYQYGEHIGDNEIKMAEYLNSLPQEQIDKIADVYVQGYQKGFVNTGKDLSKKGTVDIRYNIGFERLIRSAIGKFAQIGLKPVIYRGGYQSTQPNRQYSYDHKFDEALFLDSAYVKRKLEVVKQAFENNKQLAAHMAGPAVVEIFGEMPFEPESKEEAYKFTKEQQKLQAEYRTSYQRIVQEYIKGDERSFTIIAFPIPEFGDDFEKMFMETVRINTLDEQKYSVVQQKLIDALDEAEYVRVEGCGDNKTHMIVQMNKLNNPDKETNFENCLADVNIPLGEVFTSPKLIGTNGILHVSKVYLNGLNFKELEIVFEDGMVKDYTCKNFEKEEDNKKYIKDNILFQHDTLPIGEFAIGTNTTAYVIANKYDVVYKLPILIVEKMGPHFAVGDTCYSWEEDIKTYNPDGKELVAKENEVSSLRKTDISKAYFGCHTDITLPYEELGEITAVTKDGKEIVLISNGRFVLEGTQMLNEALDEK